MSRSLLAGRVLALISLAGLAVAAGSSGPRWVILVLAAAGCLGLLLIVLTPAPPSATGLDELLAAATDLESAAGPGDRLHSAATNRERAAAAARQVREAGVRLRRERDLAAQREQTLLSLLDAVDEPILAAGADGLILVCNAAALDLLGLRAEKILGRPMDEAFTQADLLAVIESARRGAPTREEVRIPRPDGPRIWASAAVPFGEPVAGEHAMVLTLRDVTEQSLALQVKTDFVANASHELRTPVSAIRMAVETLEGLGEADQPMRSRLLAMITSHTLRLEELIRDLLDLSRLESTEQGPRAEPVPASTLAPALGSMFEGVCRDRNLTLRFEFDPRLEQLHSDQNLLLLILGNLIDNACKFAFEGTDVLITGKPGEDPGSARFDVTDRGVGIPINQQQRIFERFFQVNEARSGGKKRGTGLGLSIVKHAVRRLGGTIRVQSIWQRGTTMTVELPGCLPVTSSEASPQPLQAP